MLKIAYTDIYAHPLPQGHRFPMEKYELIPAQLLYEGTILPANIFAPTEIEEEWILTTHTRDYWESLKHKTVSPKMVRRIGFPLSDELIKRETIIMQGTLECSLYALQHGIALNVAGGTHHAYTNKGEGFCLLNDVAIAANYLLHTKKAKKILVVDLDVHQGNGTAEIFAKNDKVFTFSMHGEENYPLHKETSDLDIALPTYTKDEEYLSVLYNTLPKLIDEVKPDFIFYISGVDILAQDKLGKLSISMAACNARDRFVLETCHQKGIPITIAMGGGYSPKIADIVDAHCHVYRLAAELFF